MFGLGPFGIEQDNSNGCIGFYTDSTKILKLSFIYNNIDPWY